MPNDYVDIYGGTVALGRPGDGGQVEIFRADGSLNGFALTPNDVLVPSGTTPGDRVGHSVDIDGRTLAAGAPGDDLAGDTTGAVFDVSVPVVATFTGAVDSDWDVPGNWDVGVVPEPSDTAIVPIAGLAEVDSFVEASVIVSSEGQLNVLAGGTFVPYSDWSGTPSQVEGTIEIQSGGSLTMVAGNSLALAGGAISNLAGGAVRFEAFDEPIAIAGIGNWFNSGALIKDGPAVADIEEGITWTSDVTSDINVVASGLTFFMPVFEEGSVIVEADASVSYLDDFSATSGAVLTVAIEGPGPSTTDHGTFYFDSFDPPGFGFATLRTVGGYAPVGGDVYDVISCYDCGSPELIYDIGSLVPFVAGITGFDFIQLAAPSDIVVDTLDGIDDPDGNCSLLEAVQAANTDSPVDACFAGSDSATDTIVFDVTGTILLEAAIDPIDTDLVIDGSGQGITISGQNSTSIMSVDVGGSVDLLDLTIADGIGQACPDSSACGAVLNEGSLNVAWVTFSGNNSGFGGNGAAITNDQGGQLDVSYSTFVNNTASNFGGAIWNRNGDADVVNSTFVGNFAAFGGAIHNNVAPATTVITNSTFSDNTAEIAVFQNANPDPGSALLRNTIIESASGFDCAGTITANGFNIDSDGSCDSATTSSLLNLQPLADNGGPTQTVALGAGSAAYDAADLGVCLASPVFGVDQRVQVRPQGAGCDSGAYESNGTPAPPAITIDTVADDNDVNGNCTLREAILAANSNAAVDACSAGIGPDTIAFDLPGAGPFTFSPTSPLPPITEPLTIDGYSQPGASANTLAVGSDAVILIELDGSSAGAADGLDFTDAGSNGSVVQGLAINGFSGSGILAGPGTQVRGNFIGTNVTGTAAASNGIGITVNSPASPVATIGGTAPGDRNVISGNSVRGIFVIADAGDVVGTTILGNYIGTDATGTAAVPNARTRASGSATVCRWSPAP